MAAAKLSSVASVRSGADLFRPKRILQTLKNRTDELKSADLTDSSATSQEPELVLNHLLPVRYCLDPPTLLSPINVLFSHKHQDMRGCVRQLSASCPAGSERATQLTLLLLLRCPFTSSPSSPSPPHPSGRVQLLPGHAVAAGARRAVRRCGFLRW